MIMYTQELEFPMRFSKKLVDNKRDYIDSMINQNIDKNRFLTEKKQGFL